MTPDERAAVMRAFRKLVRPERRPLYAVFQPQSVPQGTTDSWTFTLASCAEDLTPAEGQAVEKWLEEGK